MNATEAIAWMRANSGRSVLHAGNSRMATLSGDVVWGQCTIEGCNECQTKDSTDEWIRLHDGKGDVFDQMPTT